MNRSLRIVKRAAAITIGGFAAVTIHATAAAATETPPTEETAVDETTEQHEHIPTEPLTDHAEQTNGTPSTQENQPEQTTEAEASNQESQIQEHPVVETCGETDSNPCSVSRTEPEEPATGEEAVTVDDSEDAAINAPVDSKPETEDTEPSQHDIDGEFNNGKILNKDGADTTSVVAVETDGGYYPSHAPKPR